MVVVVVAVVGITVTDTALAQPVTVEEGTVITNVMIEMLGGVKRVIIQLDILLVVVATLTIQADTVAAEGISEGKVFVS